MHIHTIEDDYDYRMRQIVKEFIEDYNLQDYSPEELQNYLWTRSLQFGHAVLEDMYNYGGDELFEICSQ